MPHICGKLPVLRPSLRLQYASWRSSCFSKGVDKTGLHQRKPPIRCADKGRASEQEISAEKAHEILKRISDEDCEALGFDVRYARPDWMLMTVFPVPPPPVRPGVMMDSSSRWQSALITLFSLHLVDTRAAEQAYPE